MQRRAGGNTHGDAFFFRQQFGRRKGVRAFRFKHFVVKLGIQYFRYKACADALDLMGACPAFG